MLLTLDMYWDCFIIIPSFLLFLCYHTYSDPLLGKGTPHSSFPTSTSFLLIPSVPSKLIRSLHHVAPNPIENPTYVLVCTYVSTRDVITRS